MKKCTYISIILFFTLSTSLMAQSSYSEQIKVDELSISKQKGITDVVMEIDVSELRINRNDLILVTPVLISNETGDFTELEPLAVVGKLRNRILNRPFTWEGKPVLPTSESNRVVRTNGTSQKLHYHASVPFNEWQRNARLEFKTEVIGCADCSDLLANRIINPKILPDLFKPDYHLMYITPEVEEIKQRKESYSAHLNYIVGRWDLLPHIENNAHELARVDQIIHELQEDKDLTITEFTISGYASPEDTQERNLRLSQRRAETFANYMVNKHGYNTNQFTVEWHGEDWDGLKEAVLTSSIENKEEIIKIIDSEPNVDARDALLTALDNGRTYNRLLREFYPLLRRNEYHITFVSRPFNVQEAANILKTRPKLLSLNEIFLVAQTFPEDSPQYKEAFDIAADTFPDNPLANINAAVGQLRSNNPDGALARLNKVTDHPVAWNLLGVAHAMKGELDQAKDYLNRAVQNGDKNARHNLDELEKYIQDIM